MPDGRARYIGGLEESYGRRQPSANPALLVPPSAVYPGSVGPAVAVHIRRPAAAAVLAIVTDLSDTGVFRLLAAGPRHAAGRLGHLVDLGDLHRDLEPLIRACQPGPTLPELA